MIDAVHRSIEAVYKIESARLIAGLVRVVRDVGRAEELAQDALVAALEQWPLEGVPDNPGAWLMEVGKRRAVDAVRRGARFEQKQQALGHEIAAAQQLATPDLEARLDENVGDDLLRLVLIACHPVLSTEGRVALTLRLLGGLTTEEIARAFLVPEPTIAQRIVRAKRTLAEARATFEVPRGPQLRERLSSVLEVIYLIFNEGYAATAGDDVMRPGLCEDALRLGRILAGLLPDEPEVHGLVALLELQASRAAARVDAAGDPILLLDQSRSRWDQLLIRRGLEGLARAEALNRTQSATNAAGANGNPPASLGPYQLQAQIAACHARARTNEETDWTTIAALYEALALQAGSPVVELNRAVALSMAHGPEVGLQLVDQLVSEPSLARYHLLPSVRGDLLVKLGRADEARIEFERAAALTKNGRERKLLLGRAAACARGD